MFLSVNSLVPKSSRLTRFFRDCFFWLVGRSPVVTPSTPEPGRSPAIREDIMSSKSFGIVSTHSCAACTIAAHRVAASKVLETLFGPMSTSVGKPGSTPSWLQIITHLVLKECQALSASPNEVCQSAACPYSSSAVRSR